MVVTNRSEHLEGEHAMLYKLQPGKWCCNAQCAHHCVVFWQFFSIEKSVKQCFTFCYIGRCSDCIGLTQFYKTLHSGLRVRAQTIQSRRLTPPSSTNTLTPPFAIHLPHFHYCTAMHLTKNLWVLKDRWRRSAWRLSCTTSSGKTLRRHFSPTYNDHHKETNRTQHRETNKHWSLQRNKYLQLHSMQSTSLACIALKPRVC